MTDSTLKALINLKSDYDATRCPLEHFIKLRDKHLSRPKIKWIKHIYSWNVNSAEMNEKYDFLNIENPIVLNVITVFDVV